MKITVVGIGYVGLSNAILLAQGNRVIALDLSKEKVDLVNQRISPLEDEYIRLYLSEKELDLVATIDESIAYQDPDYVIIATPTDYDEETNYFNTSTVEKVIEKVYQYCPHTTVIIKSTIPVGFTTRMKEKYTGLNVIFSPEFLREGKALYDNLYPSRIIVGDHGEEAIKFAQLLVDAALKEDIDVLHTGSTEAEAIKLFSNTFLALRVSFFNELDSFAEIRHLSTEEIITGVCLDPRIGDYYNNPSFGYGGYCLPKDTKQLLANYQNIPQSIMSAVVDANRKRKEHIASMIMKKNPNVVGIYRLTMKKDSDNFRQTAISGVMNLLQDSGIKIVVFEPNLNKDDYYGNEVIQDFDEFKSISDVIIANRFEKELNDVLDKVYSRDVFSRD